MTRFMLVGPYGRCNIGDNLILELILDELKQFDFEVIVSCSDPFIVSRLYDVETTSLLEYRSLATQSLKIMKQMDAVIIGGGEQLSEPRIPNPVWGHLARTAHLARVAKDNSIPLMLWAVGLDVIRSPISRWLIQKWICSPLNIISLRDYSSVTRMEQIAPDAGITFFETIDPAFSLPHQEKNLSRNWLHHELGIPDDGRKLLLLVPANDKLADLSYIDELIEFGRKMWLRGYRILGWITDLQDSYDIILAERPDWEKIPDFIWIPRVLYKHKAFSMIVNAVDIVVSARMHPLIVSYTQSTPSISLSRSIKMVSFSTTYSIRHLPITAITSQKLCGLCKEIEVEQDVPYKRTESPSLASKIFIDHMLPLLK